MLYHRHNSTFVFGINHGVTFQMSNLSSCLKIQGPFTQVTSVGYLPLATPCTCIALFSFASKCTGSSKHSSLSLVSICMLINGFMAYGQLRGKLSGTPLHVQQCINLIFHQRSYRVGFAAVVVRSIVRNIIGLYGSVTSRTNVAAQLTREC